MPSSNISYSHNYLQSRPKTPVKQVLVNKPLDIRFSFYFSKEEKLPSLTLMSRDHNAYNKEQMSLWLLLDVDIP